MIDKVGKQCSGCGACASSCPQKCIELYPNPEGFRYPRIDRQHCIQCQICERACPVLSGCRPQEKITPEAWGAFAKDEKVLLGSSSGGLFSLLAQTVLEKGGVVYGAAFSEDYRNVRHVRVDALSKLEGLKGSKYVQSDMADVYERVRHDINSGKTVLFTGTPCQAAGLRCCAGKEYDNLLIIDVLCHGVPSPLLWQRYLENRGGGRAIYSAAFRDKRHGWKNYGVSIDGQGTAYYKAFKDDLYMQLFLKNYCLRESCYDCQVKRNGSGSDMTIGDFWGVERVAPELNNEKGVSIALPHAKKGRACLEWVKDRATIKQVNHHDAISYNPMLYESVGRPLEREHFFEDLRVMDWKRFENKYGGMIWKQNLREKMSTTLLYRGLRKAKHKLGL